MKQTVIVADSSFVTETLRLALRGVVGLKVVGKVDGRTSIRRPIATCQPDIALVDEMQNPEDALERIRECRDEAPSSVVVLLTKRMDDGYTAQAFAAGIDACISKEAPMPTLGTLIREVISRNVITALPPAVAAASSSAPDTEDLTGREREILGLVADGMTNATIGKRLWITEQTVKFHLSNIYRKFNVSNRTEASRFAYAHGLLRRPRPHLASAPEFEGELAPVHTLRPVRTPDAA